jgi:hypothetical protein
MPSTYTIISSNTLSSSAASVTFSSIPATFTDLVLRTSTRTSRTGIAVSDLRITLNGSSSTVYSWRVLNNGFGSISANGNDTQSYWQSDYSPTAAATSNTFGSSEVYLPNYLSSTKKPSTSFGVAENMSTDSYRTAYASLADITSAVTSITITASIFNFVSGSSFYLYGIKNS